MPAELLIKVFRVWTRAWPWVAIWALLFSLLSALFRNISAMAESSLSRLVTVVFMFAMWAFTEAVFMIMAGHVFLGARAGLVRPAKDATSVFGELFLTELCILSPVVFVFVLLVASGAANQIFTVFMMIPALYVGLRWAVAGPSLILEQEGPFNALRRSWAITSGRVPFLIVSFLGGFAPGILWILLGKGMGFQWSESEGMAVTTGFVDGLFVSWLSFLGVGLFLSLRAQNQAAQKGGEES